MVAATNACYCAECGVKCTSKFPGCRDVWAGKPPVPSTFVELSVKTLAATAAGNGANPRPEPLAPPLTAAAAPTGAAHNPSHEVESSLADLRNVVSQLVSTVERLVEAEHAVFERHTALDKSVTHIENEVTNVSKGLTVLATSTGDALHKHKEALRLIAKRLQGADQRRTQPQAASGGSSSRPQSGAPPNLPNPPSGSAAGAPGPRP